MTFLDGTGAYSRLPKKVIFSIITMTELSKMRELVFDIDPEAFMVVNDTLEVLGYRHGSRRDYTEARPPQTGIGRDYADVYV